MTIDSAKEWLASWGDGPNWSDSTGATVPITKESLRALLANADRMRAALQDLRTQALDSREFLPATAASLAITCEDAFEGV